MDLHIPDWLHQRVIHWRERLLLEHWKITLERELCVNEEPNTMALVTSSPSYNRVNISFRADVEDNEEWQTVILHEMLHVGHTQIDWLICETLIPRLDQQAQEIARDSYRQLNESYITNLTTVIERLMKDHHEKHSDAPEARRPDEPAADGAPEIRERPDIILGESEQAADPAAVHP